MATDTADLVSMLESLPVEIKITIVDSILESLSPTEKAVDDLWKVEVERRIEEIETGKGQTVSGEEVFDKIRQRFGK